MSKIANQSGQTLVALLIYILLAITVTSAAATITVINIRGGLSGENAQSALSNAEAGVENALIRLERDSGYTGETLTLSSGSAVISVSGSTTKTIISVGSAGNAKRTITATASLSGTVITLTSWNETP